MAIRNDIDLDLRSYSGQPVSLFLETGSQVLRYIHTHKQTI